MTQPMKAKFDSSRFHTEPWNWLEVIIIQSGRLQAQAHPLSLDSLLVLPVAHSAHNCTGQRKLFLSTIYQ